MELDEEVGLKLLRDFALNIGGLLSNSIVILLD